jgi:hypothetical protein
MSKKIIIADPSIVSDKGHNLKLSLEFAKKLKNHEVLIITSKKFNKLIKVPKNIKILNFFNDSDFYQSSRKKLSFIFFLKIIFLIKKRLSLSINDLVIFPTIDGLLYSLISKLIISSQFLKLPKFLFLFSYDPFGSIPNKILVKNLKFWNFGIFYKIFKSKKFFFFSDSPALKLKLNSYFKSKFKTLIPIFNFDTKKKEDWVTVLGNARQEKGFELIPEILDKFIKADKELFKKITFNIQCSPQIIGYNQIIIKSIEKLKELKKKFKNINLIFYNLNDDEYNNLIIKSKIVMCPYSNRQYEYRSSYIFYEALCAQSVIISQKNMFIDKSFKNNPTSCLNIDEYVKVIKKIFENNFFYNEQISKQNKFLKTYKKMSYDKVLEFILRS